jgi:hypothetical protein
MHPSAVQSVWLQRSSFMQWPGPPGKLGLSGQQINPLSQAFSTPPLQRQPWLVQLGVCGPIGLQPTIEDVHVPGLPGGALGSFAQQSSVVGPHGS